MTKFDISNTLSGAFCGTFEGATKEEALNAYARDAGYADYAAACEVAPVREGEIVVEEASAALVTYRVVFSSNAGSSASEALAFSCGGAWGNAVQRFDGENDMAFIECPVENVEYLESLMDDDENVISYSVR